jgi:hypothetical protein
MQKLSDGNYDSVAAFMAATGEIRCESNRAEVAEFLRGNRHGSYWYGAGCKNGEDVIRLISDGWPEGRESVAALAAKTSAIELAPMDRRRRLTRSDQGDHLDIHAVYRGHLDKAWTVARRMSARGPAKVDILANMLCSGGASSSVLQWRGAAAVTLADKLGAAGYMVRIVVGFGGRTGANRSETCSCRITVKDYDAPLNVSTAASVTLPGFFRALGHAWNSGHCKGPSGQFGMSVQSCRTEAGEIVLSHEIMSETTAIDAIERIIRGIDEAAMAA